VVDRHQLNVGNLGSGDQGRGQRRECVQAYIESIESRFVGGVIQGRHALHDATRHAGLRAVRPCIEQLLTAFVTRSIRKVILLLRCDREIILGPAVGTDIGFMTGEAAILRGSCWLPRWGGGGDEIADVGRGRADRHRWRVIHQQIEVHVGRIVACAVASHRSATTHCFGALEEKLLRRRCYTKPRRCAPSPTSVM